MRVHNADLRRLNDAKKIWAYVHHKQPQLTQAQLQDFNELVNNFINTSSIYMKIRKQMDGITNKDIVRKIAEHFLNIITNNTLTYGNIFSKLTGVMDIYTILRMLRDFNETKNSHNRTKHWKQKNIIGYFGAAHVFNIKKLLIKLGAKEKYNTNIHPFTIDVSFLEIDEPAKLEMDKLIM
jgi:hypothetical protein